jgi:hypothetical protein
MDRTYEDFLQSLADNPDEILFLPPEEFELPPVPEFEVIDFFDEELDPDAAADTENLIQLDKTLAVWDEIIKIEKKSRSLNNMVNDIITDPSGKVYKPSAIRGRLNRQLTPLGIKIKTDLASKLKGLQQSELLKLLNDMTKNRVQVMAFVFDSHASAIENKEQLISRIMGVFYEETPKQKRPRV